VPTLELRMKYAWEWFEYHAGQRLTAFNFFLVLTGAVVVAYAQAVAHHSKTLGVGLGLFGGLVAFAFWAMDVRNEELVNCGREALDRLEEVLGMSIRRQDSDRAQLQKALRDWPQNRIYGWVAKDKRRRGRWLTHGRWLRIVIVATGALSLAAGGWACAGY